ncbi:MAG: hypothetical protein KDJ74_15920 [Notoacmeibacter sp.]|nr:hypothetical protein [Notoacmeibacter sp.]
MTISKDLFLAILSMDAYNRGYGAGLTDGQHIVEGIDHGLGDSSGIEIGNAVVTAASDSDPLSPEASAGFYAVAYKITGTGYDGLAAGQTVISYRGTDAFLTEYPGVDFPIVTGDYDEAELNLAVQFYRSVAASQSIGALTGHSLGGALTRPCRRPASDARRGAA